MGILLGVKKMVAVTLAAASDITSELGRHCPSPMVALPRIIPLVHKVSLMAYVFSTVTVVEPSGDV